MVHTDMEGSPPEAAAGTADQRAVEAFELLSNETRLTILLALWEAYDRFDDANAVGFSELYDRVEIGDSGNFTYHLDKLTDHFVEETDDGYQLRNAGLRLVQPVTAGTGLGERTVAPSEIDMSCFLCGAPTEVSYDEERIFVSCTDCQGLYGPSSPLPPGTLISQTFDPAGLIDRAPGDLLGVASVKMFKGLEQFLRGFCSVGGGPIEQSLRICEDHDPAAGEVCQACGTRDEIQIQFVCSVCKHTGVFSAQAAVHGHPAVVSFCHENDITRLFDVHDAAAYGRSGNTSISASTPSTQPIRSASA